jgi:hypothetical protein
MYKDKTKQKAYDAKRYSDPIIREKRKQQVKESMKQKNFTGSSKICSKCKQEKPLSEFRLAYGNPRSQCRICSIASDKQSRQTPESLERRRKQSILHRRRTKRKLLAELGVSHCSQCNESHLACLDFHHCNGDKKFRIAKYHKPYDVLLAEARKCIVLCANCHRKIHYIDENL